MNTTTASLDAAFIGRLPKVDLHCHLIGTVRASTFAEMARREGLALPDAPERIYCSINSPPPESGRYRNTTVPIPSGPSADEPETSYSLVTVAGWVTQTLRHPEDLTRIVYEAFEDAHMSSNVRHLELFIDSLPTHLDRLGYAGCIQAYSDGIRQAERDFAMTGLLIQGIDRSRSAEHALSIVRQVVDHPADDVVGIGLDNLETAGPPERFEAAYRLAGEAGLRRTAHSSEHVPSAANTVACLDVLGCDRIDHGYFVLEDEEVVERVRGEQVAFTVAATTSRRSWRPWRRASIARMLAAGLNVIPCSDDPGMFPTTLTDEYRIIAAETGAGLDQLGRMALEGVRASWLSDGRKAALLDRFRREIESATAD